MFIPKICEFGSRVLRFAQHDEFLYFNEEDIIWPKPHRTSPSFRSAHGFRAVGAKGFKVGKCCMHEMMFVLLVIAMTLLLGCFAPRERSTLEIPGPNQQVVLRFVSENNYGFFLPGPEPPRLKSRKICIDGYTDSQKSFSVELPQFDLSTKATDGCDVKWSEDGKFFAVKTPNDLLIYDESGTESSRFSMRPKEKISSISWQDDKHQVIVVVKDVRYETDFGYTEESFGIRIMHLSPYSNEPKTVFAKRTPPVTFLFSGLEFYVQEISQSGEYVTFSTGRTIELYNVEEGRIKHSIEAADELHGVWWANEKEVILALGILTGMNRYLYYSLAKRVWRDVSSDFSRWSTSDVYGKNWYENVLLHGGFSGAAQWGVRESAGKNRNGGQP